MPLSLSDRTPIRWGPPALVLAVVLIVVGPFVVLRQATMDSDAAADALLHSREVEAQVHALASDVRNVESGALSLAAGIDHPRLRERIADARPRIVPGLQALLQLVRDDPEQQRRVGELQSNIALRMAQAERIIETGEGATVADIDAMVARYPIHGLIRDIVAEEQRVLVERQQRADRVRRRASFGAWAAMLAQLVLLGGVTWFSTRQVARRMDAERDAARAAARAGAVLDTVREPIVLADSQLRVVMHNASFAELYGVEDDIVGQPLADIGGGVWHDERTLRRLRDVLSRGRELWDYEQVQRTADGIERTMLINARRMPLPDSDAEVALVTASDISLAKASERQIIELNRQLEGKVEQVSDVNRELEAFSYSVSHDLRAPLRHIAGFGDKLGRHLGDSLDDKGRHYIEVMVSSARRMSALIDDLLAYSRLGRSALRMQLVDMQSLAAETRAMLDANNAADHPGHAIEWKIAPLPVVVGDENMLRQVLQNLMGNAAKYSVGSEPALVEVSYAPGEDGMHHFMVRDNGAGFDMQYAGKLFGVFQRLHSASEFPGSGIGLASVRRVLSRHGGRIWAEAEPGAGATFHFTLPVAGETPAASRGTTT